LNRETASDPTPRAASEVLLGFDLIDFAGATIAEKFSPSACAIISDTTVGGLFGERVRQSLASAGFVPTLITIPPGESSKTLAQTEAICGQMIAADLDRRSFVVGLGGGVVGDLSGFAAAIYKRGIPHVQIPTTLLAMVDSSIGGKTGVNTDAGKNLLGAIHHPLLLIDDIDVLKTLPPRERRQGFAEIVKHGVIADGYMFAELENVSTDNLAPLIRRNIEIKAAIVAQDEFDLTGERALLNFGHTIAHALERAGNYEQFLHGEAVSLGMVAACAISIKKAGLAEEERDAVVARLDGFDLPTRLPRDFPREKILEALPFDKKFEGGQIRFVLTPAIGSAFLSADVTMQDIAEAVAAL
jgi:3-dehydroquinate synthase